MKNGMSKKTKRLVVVISTIVGVIALFLVIVFAPVGIQNHNTNEEKAEKEVVEEIKLYSKNDMSKSEMEKRIKELETENEMLKADVEKYKILAEQTTKAVAAPAPAPATDKEKNSQSKEKPKTDKSNGNNDLKSSSEFFYDENYLDYTDEDDDNKSDTQDVNTSDDNKNSDVSNNSNPNTSENGL